ncbi:Hypothetical_protein [Hexamita inflata]|uniref:Hypothetical_protein n=1 Tax=Hexamita inflata TaxID=28002 RepID=A0AA86QLC1_9EUKA|nr:Hypothetical protein HINF_LOCUS46272 [Hexamita inflata]
MSSHKQVAIEFIQAELKPHGHEIVDKTKDCQQFILVNHKHEVMLIQLDPIFKLPFSKSIFNTTQEAKKYLLSNFSKITSKLTGQIFLGVATQNGVSKYFIANDADLQAKQDETCYYFVRQVDSVSFVQIAHIPYTTQLQVTNKLLQQCFIVTNPSNFIYNEFFVNSSLLKPFRDLRIPLLGEIVIGSVQLQGVFMKKPIINGIFVDYFLPFSKEDQILLYSNTFLQLDFQALQKQKVVEKQDLKPTSFNEIYNMFYMKSQPSLNPTENLPALPPFAFNSNMDKEAVQFFNHLSEKHGSFLTVQIICQIPEIKEKLLQIVQFVGFTVVENRAKLVVNVTEKSPLDKIDFKKDYTEMNELPIMLWNLQPAVQKPTYTRYVYQLPYTSSITKLMIFGKNVSVGHLRVYTGYTLSSLQLCYDKQIFLSKHSEFDFVQIPLPSLSANFVLIDSSHLRGSPYVLGFRTDCVKQLSTSHSKTAPVKLLVQTSNLVPLHIAILDRFFSSEVNHELKLRTNSFVCGLRILQDVSEETYNVLVSEEMKAIKESFTIENVILDQQSIAVNLLEQELIVPSQQVLNGLNLLESKFAKQQYVQIMDTTDYKAIALVNEINNDFNYTAEEDTIMQLSISAPQSTLKTIQFVGQIIINDKTYTNDFEILLATEKITIHIKQGTKINRFAIQAFGKAIYIPNSKQLQSLSIKNPEHGQLMDTLINERKNNYTKIGFTVYQHQEYLDVKLKHESKVVGFYFSQPGLKKIIFKVKSKLDEFKVKNIFKDAGAQINSTLLDEKMYQIDVIKEGAYFINPYTVAIRIRIIGDSSDLVVYGEE